MPAAGRVAHMEAHGFSDGDLAELKARGITTEAVLEQLRLYREPPPPVHLVRACVVGDGIRRLSDEQVQYYASSYDEEVCSLAVAKFVPASGAASRMFRSLLSVAADPELRTRPDLVARNGDDTKAVLQLLAELDRFAFYEDLRAAVEREGVSIEECAGNNVPLLLAMLLEPSGLGYASLPKGLLAFHRDHGEVRTAFEEHLVEAAQHARGQGDLCRLHLTVSPEHEVRFGALLASVRERYEQRFGVHFQVEFSHQEPSTDTVAVDLEGNLVRDRSGRLLFRPAGHGALIGNLGSLGCDLVFVKNIDNVTVDEWKPGIVLWKRALAGVLLELRAEVFACRRAMETGDPGAVAAALKLLHEHFGVDVPAGLSEQRVREFALDRLDRPLRACGMIRSDADPGGGPFWVLDAQGHTSVQIVETSQIDRNSDQQRGILKSATHFNPVDLVCSTRDWKGRAFDLERFIDHAAVFIAEKSQDGRPLRSLERPGLWNGAMAGWNTVFVEVPAETFHPVKTIGDLLAAAHQGRGG